MSRVYLMTSIPLLARTTPPPRDALVVHTVYLSDDEGIYRTATFSSSQRALQWAESVIQPGDCYVVEPMAVDVPGWNWEEVH